jgi:hypothetical protein
LQKVGCPLSVNKIPNTTDRKISVLSRACSTLDEKAKILQMDIDNLMQFLKSTLAVNKLCMKNVSAPVWPFLRV